MPQLSLPIPDIGSPQSARMTTPRLSGVPPALPFPALFPQIERCSNPDNNSEFQEESGTIPQRLLLMNGKLVGERTGENPVMNSSTRVAHYSSSEKQAVDAAFLALLTRHPTPEESEHFAASLEKKNPKSKARASADLYWALINSTEFSWNR